MSMQQTTSSLYFQPSKILVIMWEWWWAYLHQEKKTCEKIKMTLKFESYNYSLLLLDKTICYPILLYKHTVHEIVFYNLQNWFFIRRKALPFQWIRMIIMTLLLFYRIFAHLIHLEFFLSCFAWWMNYLLKQTTTHASKRKQKIYIHTSVFSSVV